MTRDNDQWPKQGNKAPTPRVVLILINIWKSKHHLGGGNSNIFFTPNVWGRWTQFDEHFFQVGWNHQLDIFPVLSFDNRVSSHVKHNGRFQKMITWITLQGTITSHGTHQMGSSENHRLEKCRLVGDMWIVPRRVHHGSFTSNFFPSLGFPMVSSYY